MATEYLVNVSLEERSYPIHIQRNSFKRWGERLYDRVNGRRCLIISDSNVYALYADKIVDALSQAGAYLYASVFPAGEQSKSLDRVGKMYHKAASAGLGRDALIIALGGGVTGDIAGFVAATWMRGIDFIQIPTSLLAMVDSSVGGKTGVDLPEGKNLVGAFWQPREVLIDPDMLKTLPDREITCGLAEIIKYGVIEDARFFTQLENNAGRIMKRDLDYYTDMIIRSCQIKADVVAADEREGGRRAILNYGHTFGHALEAAGGFGAYNHGEAVSVGMCLAADLSVSLGMMDLAAANRIESLLRSAGLPVYAEGDYAAETLIRLIGMDKKNRQGSVRWVLPEAIGRVSVVSDVPMDKVQDVIRGRIK